MLRCGSSAVRVFSGTKQERRVKPKPSAGQDTELANTREQGGGTRWGRPLFCRIYIITGNYEDDEGE